MGSFIINTLFIIVLVTIIVTPLGIASGADWKATPRWLVLLVIVLFVLALLLVPVDSQALANVFRTFDR